MTDKKVIKKLDVLFSQYIRGRAKYICERCGSSKSPQCCHFHSRRKHTTRWDETNACCLCPGCHLFLDSHPLEKVEFFKKKIGKAGFEHLNVRANMYFKVDHALMEIYLEKQLEAL